MIDTNIHSYEPSQGHGLPHDPFNSIVGPRPIGWISTRSGSGSVNLAPYSFFNAFNYVPPIIGFCSIGYKDTVRNIEETKEFVWNLVTRPIAEAMNASCAAVPCAAQNPMRRTATSSAARIAQVFSPVAATSKP